MIDLSRALAIPGWMDPPDLEWLAHAASRATRIVEIGSWKGRSTRALADHTSGVVYAIDPWSGAYLGANDRALKLKTTVRPAFDLALQDHITSGRVVPMQAVSAVAVPQLLAQFGRTFDLVFIDGDHRGPQVTQDMALARTLLRDGGIMSGHDYNCKDWPEVGPAVRASLGYPPEVVKYIWWTEVNA
jgi:predicted O-methyltransferase YrrM